MDSCEAAGAASPLATPLAPPPRDPSCDLLSHTSCQPATLLPHLAQQRARSHLSDRKLSLQERSQTSAPPPCSAAGLSGRYIYPSLPYSPVTSPHTSPRLPRRPTVESHSVSITDLQVGGQERCLPRGWSESGLFHLFTLNAP